MKRFLVRAINRLLRPFGYSLVTKQSLLLSYQHDYGSEAYESYKKVQILHNKRKIDEVWADDTTLIAIANYLQETDCHVQEGICHGTRRGYEQAKFSELLDCPVVGTEISDTASQFPDTLQWDFHDQKPEWIGNFSFVYSNSLDQAFDPRKALSSWVGQLKPHGLLFLDYTMAHSPEHASEMDPFGAHPMIMPYLIFKWGKNQYQLVDILELEHPKKSKVWIFVIGHSDPASACTQRH